MASIIRLLDDTTINKIAAGEVIENPASVVKELIDNAIDAGAKSLTVEIKAGGRQLIRITDDGRGMSHDDALLSLERHATSKIRALDDINVCQTLGFRGEAIPSIASISKFTLLTAQEGASVGSMVVVDGGKVIKHCEAARSRGTTIEVKSLFFNVPVRKKFQRSTAADTTEIQTMVSKLALARPDIAFHLISNQKSILKSAACKEEEFGCRVSDVLGRDYYAGLKPITFQRGPMRLHGFIGQPSFTRHNRSGQFLVLNGRPVLCPLVAFAVIDGFGSRVQPRRHPVFVLHLDLPPDWIDVNVHPQKREVRLRRGSNVRAFIAEAIDQLWRPIPTSMPSTLPPPAATTAISFSPPQKEWKPLDLPVEAEPTQRLEIQAPSLFEQPSAFRALTVMDRYVLLESESKLILLDYRAAQERIRYEEFLGRLSDEKTSSIESQALLMPITLTLSVPEASQLRQYLPQLRALGLDIDEFGKEDFAVNGVPSFLKEGAIERFVEELVQALDHQATRKSEEAGRHRRLALAASRAARGPAPTLSEGEALYRTLQECKLPLEAPDGRPTTATIAPEKLPELFERNRLCNTV